MKKPEHRWAEQIREGDRAAFEEMFYAYYPQLCAFAVEYVKSQDRARDVVQEVFLRIWERRAEWNLRGSLKAYLYQAVRNRALNHVRRNKRRDLDTPLDGHDALSNGQTAEDQFHFRELSDAVQDAISQLPERRRMTFLLHRRHGFSYAEIAQIMDVTSKTVENQIGRALKFLRSQIFSTFEQN